MDRKKELNWIVREHLELNGFEETLRVFCMELSKENLDGEKNECRPLNVRERVQKRKNELMMLFENGHRQKFFDVWVVSIPFVTREENDSCRHLEFYLHIHFAVFPLRFASNDKELLHERMNYFKNFLETRGSYLSQTSEFLPFYALPYIPHPKTHPSFEGLFKNNWVDKLREKLDKFLDDTLKSGLQSRLNQLLTTEKSQEQQLQQAFSHIAELSQKLISQQQHTKKIQEDYQKLIGLSAELIGSLELAVQGELSDVDPIINLCARSFPEIFGGNTSNFMSHPPMIPPLNMEKIRGDLMSGSHRTVALLLQALRWRLTKCKHWNQQVAILVSYIAADLLGCMNASSYRTRMMTLISFPLQEISQSMARLLNVFACFREGRLYLAQCPELVSLLLDNLMQRKTDSITLDMTLATLQKLSLRRNHQMIMIGRGTIEWLLGTLEDHDSMTDYSLEYAVALFMNLCLRSAGKHRCASNPRRVLKMLTDLLGNQNQEIVPYVNGALYSVLCVASIRKEAQAIAMEDILRCFIEEGNSEMRRQLEFILKQLSADSTTEQESDDENKDDDDDDEDEDDEESHASLEADLDRDDCVQVASHELNGEDFLAANYLLFSNNVNSKTKKNGVNSSHAEVFTCPVTPRPCPSNETEKIHNLDQILPTLKESKSRKKNSKTSNQTCVDKTPANDEKIIENKTIKPPEPDIKDVEIKQEKEEDESNKEVESKDCERNQEPMSVKNDFVPTVNATIVSQPDDYVIAFSTRPKIPRTPDSGGRPTVNTPTT